VSQLNGQNGALEGWRAVLTVVLRYGMGQRQRMRLTRTSTEKGSEANGSGGSGELVGLDGVEAMVAGVKRRGVSVIFYIWTHYMIDIHSYSG
jgi:hypothetical protein